MHTKMRFTLAAALVACLLGGSAAFWIGKSRAEARGASLMASAPPSTPSGRAPSAAATAATAATVSTAPDIRAKLEQAVAGWRSQTEHRRRLQALEIVDRLLPGEVPVALEVLATVRSDYGLHLALGQRIAVLWGAHEPEPALTWLVGELPREHRGDPIQAILTDWSQHHPQEALAWWQRVTDSLDFPIPENQFDGFEQVVYSGWAIHDPAALAGQLPEMSDPEELERHEGTSVEKQLQGLATAAVDPVTRAATLAAIAAIPAEGTRAAAAGITAMMMNVSDAAAGRDFLLSLPFANPATRGDLLGQAAMVGVMMNQQSPAEAVAWLRTHTDEATTRRTVEEFLEAKENEPVEEVASALRAALETR